MLLSPEAIPPNTTSRCTAQPASCRLWTLKNTTATSSRCKAPTGTSTTTIRACPSTATISASPPPTGATQALTFNKYALNNYLRPLAGSDFHIADSVLVRRGGERPTADDVARRIGYPCFVKPNAGGSSFGVSKVKSADELADALDKALMESHEAMIEHLLTGTEITCGCYRRDDGLVVFPITEVVTSEEFFDYDAKYNGKVSEITPARIAPETADRVKRVTASIYEHLDCYGIIRIDYILSGEAGHETINLLEINTTPGMTATSFIPQQVRAAGLEMKDVLADIIEGKLNADD